MFVTYLSVIYKNTVKCETPVDLHGPVGRVEGVGTVRGESGDAFEEIYFGGVLIRGADNSLRDPRFMVDILS